MLSDALNIDPPNPEPSGLGQMPSLIELFSAKLPPTAPTGKLLADVDQAMWEAEFTHRTKNLAQLFTSLGQVAARLPDLGNPDEVARQAAALSVAYAELGQDGESAAGFPCARLLRQVVLGLVALFEPNPGAIAVTFASDELSLSHDRCRALVLVASELIVNALKYAFPAGGGGTIGVSLIVAGNWVELVVEDNGVGLSGSEQPGRGVPLIDALCAKLDATLDRASPAQGLRISLNFRVAERVSAR